MAFDDLLAEVIRLKNNGKATKILSGSNYKIKYCPELHDKVKNPIPTEIYSLGERYAGIYFTRREAECMILLLRGKTINGVANVLNLSPRTVEYYIKNMKAKVGCRTKFELVDLVHASDFMRGVNFVGPVMQNK